MLGNDEEALETSMTRKKVHAATWHTSSTDRTAEESSCSSFGSFGCEDDCIILSKKNHRGRKPPRNVSFAPTNQIISVESWLDYSELWWDEEEMMDIKGDCNVIVRQLRKNQDLVDSITSILAQGMTGTHDAALVKKFMSQMKKCEDARGLERDAAPPCAKLIQAHYKCVFDMQQKLHDKGLLGSEKGTEALAKACEKSSKAFALLAVRMAQHDIRQAMKAAFTFKESGATAMDKGQRMQRRASTSGVVNKSTNFTMSQVSRRASLTASSSHSESSNSGGPSSQNRRNVMAKKSQGLDRRKMLAHSVSMRSVKSKYGSLGI